MGENDDGGIALRAIADSDRTWAWIVGGAALALVLVGGLPTSARADAEEATSSVASNSNNTDSSQPGEYRLAPGDRLSIMVFGQSDLSGDFVVDGAGQILLPLAGQVTVGGITAAKAQQLIHQRFAEGILVEPTISVRIAEYRPIFVIGDVRNPGSYPFRFGQSIRAAIASAGGQGRASRPDMPMTEFILADERVRLLESNRRGLLVRKARLEAQLDEAADFAMPQPVGLGADKTEVSLIYVAENNIFHRHSQVHRNQIQMLQRQRPRLETEMKAVSEQKARERHRLGLANERVAELKDYKRKGLVPNYVLNEQQREEARIESEVARLEAQVARLQQNMGDIDSKIEEVKAQYKRQTLTELQEVQQRLREIEVTLGTARELRVHRALDVGGIEDVERGYTILVTRTRHRGATTLKANNDTLLEPGDLIEVKRQRTSPPPYDVIVPTMERASAQ